MIDGLVEVFVVLVRPRMEELMQQNPGDKRERAARALDQFDSAKRIASAYCVAYAVVVPQRAGDPNKQAARPVHLERIDQGSWKVLRETQRARKIAP